jgi:hypothetical protein
MGPKGAWISSRRANSRSASSGDKTAAWCAAALAGSPRPALAASHQATRHRIDQHRCITPRYRYAYKPDTDDRRRAIVRADSPDSRSAAPPSGHLADEPETRTHPPRSPQPGPSGPPGRTPSDRRPPPAACSAGTGPPRTPDTGPPAARPGGNGPGQTPTPNAQDTRSHSFQQLPSPLHERPGTTRITRG